MAESQAAELERGRLASGTEVAALTVRASHR
jgi:hypothetical protein